MKQNHRPGNSGISERELNQYLCPDVKAIAVEILQTKVTRLGKGLYGCRIIDIRTQTPIVELRVTKNQISDAFYDMLRTLDKLGYDSKMATSSRRRQKGKCVDSKYIWYI